MVINFRIRRISRDTYKLVWISTLIKKIIKGPKNIHILSPLYLVFWLSYHQFCAYLCFILCFGGDIYLSDGIRRRKMGLKTRWTGHRTCCALARKKLCPGTTLILDNINIFKILNLPFIPSIPTTYLQPFFYFSKQLFN